MKQILFFLVTLLPVLLNGQVSVHDFNCTDDGSLFYWINEDAQRSITVCPKDSIWYSASRGPSFAVQAHNVRFSGNGKYMFWFRDHKIYRAEYNAGRLTDTITIDYPGLSQSVFDVNYDGSKVLASYDAPGIPKKCSPGFRMLMSFEERDGKYQLTDTLSPPDTCKFVHQSHILPNGYVVWTAYLQEHLLKPIGNGKYEEIAWPETKLLQRKSMLVPQNGNSIFLSGYEKDPTTPTDDSVFVLYEYLFVNGTYTEPIKLREWKNYPLWSVNLSVSPDGTHINWVCHEIDPTKQHPEISDVYTMHWENGAWSEPELIFSEIMGTDQARIGWMVPSNTGIVWQRADARIVFCDGYHRGALVSEIILSNKAKPAPRTPTLYSENLVMTDTLIAGEQRVMKLQFVNTTRDTLHVTPYTANLSTQNRYHRIPTTSHSWVTLVPEFPELNNETAHGNEWVLAPGDTCLLSVLVSFSASGEKQSVTVYARGDFISGLIEWSIVPGMILKDTRRNVFDPFVGANGKPQEQCAKDKHGYVLRTWYPNGKLHYETFYDSKCKPRGTWMYYSESGVLLAERKYTGDRTYTSTTWYENGQLKAKGDYRRSCKIGTWKEYYSNGQKKSVAQFHRVWVWNIYRRHFGMDVTMGTFARTYSAWYENGQQKVHLKNDMNGDPTGVWESWYGNGNVNARYTYKGRECQPHKLVYNSDGTLYSDSMQPPKLLNGQTYDLLMMLPQLSYTSRFRYRGRGGYGGDF
ncbi:MAG TPA: hypothetical protein VK826_14485 [Bacteroidia bacterium]|nr:hypothetical protein [Bacteroidia bacterium]